MGSSHSVTTASDLLPFLLQRRTQSAGVHGTTLLALRFPEGAQRLLKVLNDAKNQTTTHLDQFLFHSVRHDLPIALSDPPVAGWAEVEVTLTTSGSGHRRRGGGRLGFLPPNNNKGAGEKIRWVKRSLVVEAAGDQKQEDE